MTTAGKNAIFISQSGFAYGAIATGVSDNQIELKIPTPSDVDFDGQVTVRVDENRFLGSVKVYEREDPFWNVKFELSPLSQLVDIG